MWVLVHLAALIALVGWNHISVSYFLVLSVVYGYIEMAFKWHELRWHTMPCVQLFYAFICSIELWLAYDLYQLWRQRRMVKMTKDDVKMLFNRDGFDDDEEQLVYGQV